MSIKTTSLYRSSEFAVHVAKKGLKKEYACAPVDYSNFKYISSTHYSHVNVIDDVPRLDVGNASGSLIPKSWYCDLRPEQKSLALLKELISRFKKLGHIVVDLFAGTFSTAMLQTFKLRTSELCMPRICSAARATLRINHR